MFRVRGSREYEDLLGIYMENGKENGNYHNIVQYSRVLLGLHHQ